MQTRMKEKLLLKIDKQIERIHQLKEQLQEQITVDYELNSSNKLLHEAQNKLIQLYDIVQHQ